jgi:hypothetical protein
MQRSAWWVAAAILVAAGSARAYDVMPVSVTAALEPDPNGRSPSDIPPPVMPMSPAQLGDGLCDGKAASDCADYCGCAARGVPYVELEFTYFRYHRADGLRVGDDAPADDINPGRFEISPRLTLGYIGAGGLGIRGRYWEYNAQLAPNEGLPSALNIDTYTIDLELFERLAINDCWDFEVSGGVRYNSFDENFFDLVGEAETRTVGFDGFGLIGALEARRQMRLGAIYGRARLGILMDDKRLTNVGSGTQDLLDTTLGVTEIAVGYELSRTTARGSLLFARFGFEYQQWSNYSSNFDSSAVEPENFWTGASDVGFAGMTFSLGWMR